MVVKGGVKGGLVVQRESSEKKFKGEKSYFFSSESGELDESWGLMMAREGL